MKKEKINNELKASLLSKDHSIVLTALNKLKVEGNSLYMPLLFDMLRAGQEMEIEKEIKNLLATVKDKDTVPYFIQVIQDENYRSILRPVLVACWQNGLDFSDHMLVFVELVIREEWEIAFEAFTVVDNFEFLPDEDAIEEIRIRITSAIPDADERHAYFLKEMLAKLE